MLEKTQLHENRACAMVSAPGAGLREAVSTAAKQGMGRCLQLHWWQLGEIVLWSLPQPEVLSVVGWGPSSLLMVKVCSLPTLEFSPLLGSKCWAVPPCDTSETLQKDLFHITMKQFTMKLLFLKDSLKNASH